MRILKITTAFILLTIALKAQTILPTPKIFQLKQGNFILGSKVLVAIQNKNSMVLPYLSKEVLKNTQMSVATANTKKKADIVFITDRTLKNEAYLLDIKPGQIVIKAAGDPGFFYAVQSIYQLLLSNKSGQLPCVYIEDEPKFQLRSFMLDSGRQYQKVATIKKYLDMMAMLKMNTFHWHLTEGLGWRIEILKYPKLTSKGAFVDGAAERQGFYTQKEIRELIKYAAARNINIIPEIDMPGHAEAALIAYPQFSCFGDTIRLKEGQGFSDNIFCAGKTGTLAFLKDVLDEVCDLFPSAYIHVGGDEAPKANWNRCSDCQRVIKSEKLENSGELQSYFSSQIANYLLSKNKKAVFWEDVMYHDKYRLPKNVVVHWWNWRGHKDEGMKKAIKYNHEVINGTNYYTYLNFPVSPWRGYETDRTFDIRDVYENNPSAKNTDPNLTLGMSTALWTDYNVTEDKIDRRLFPRIFALTEQMWHKGEALPFDQFYNNVQKIRSNFEKKRYQFGPGLKSEVQTDYQW
ncbi:beta-N-acetylhexosaminidase [Pedobacter frigoris]|uniref:beta-N-acetylhexosaminidase n=1 Tax=Pedobacter frigoris TaxID=2571272 RepID=UPI00292D8EED|nr:beta-N-acetylhexosaminidase [Pedobacter frigoris]